MSRIVVNKKADLLYEDIGIVDMTLWTFCTILVGGGFGEEEPPEPPPVPTFHTAEIPSPPGCRSVVTQQCIKVLRDFNFKFK